MDIEKVGSATHARGFDAGYNERDTKDAISKLHALKLWTQECPYSRTRCGGLTKMKWHSQCGYVRAIKVQRARSEKQTVTRERGADLIEDRRHCKQHCLDHKHGT